jgi:hypothetical protein
MKDNYHNFNEEFMVVEAKLYEYFNEEFMVVEAKLYE